MEKAGGRGRPRDASADGRILAAGLRLFLRRGYASVTTEQIAAAAGVGKQTLYRRWPTKFALALACLLQDARRAVPDDTGVGSFLRALCRGASRSAPLLRAVMAEAQHDVEARAALLEQFIRPRRRALERVLARDGVAAARRAGIVTAIYGAIWYRVLLDERLDESLAAELARLALAQ